MAIWDYPHAVVVSVYDGDSFHADIDMGMDIWRRNVMIRVAHINAPEMNTTEGKIAKAYAQTLIPVGTVVKLHCLGYDKYGGRLDAEVTLPDGSSFGEKMLDSGYAVKFMVERETKGE